MYKNKTLLFLFLLLSLFSLSFGLKVEKKVVDFEMIREIFPYKNNVYVLDYPNERLFKLSQDLNLISKINLKRRYLRDIYVYDDSIYGAQALGLFRLYPTSKNITNNVASISSFVRDNDYFYVVHYYGALSKWDIDGNLLLTTRGALQLPNLYDSAISNNYIFVSSSDSIYKFNKNLSIISKKSFPFNITGISYYGGYLLITSKNHLYIYTPDFYLQKSFNLSKSLTKFYLLSNYKLVAFDNNALFLFDERVIPPSTLIESFKKNNTLTIEELSTLSSYINKEEYGNALLYLKNITNKNALLNASNESVQTNNETLKPKKTFITINEDKEDNSGYIYILISLTLLMLIFIVLLFVAYKLSLKK